MIKKKVNNSRNECKASDYIMILKKPDHSKEHDQYANAFHVFTLPMIHVFIPNDQAQPRSRGSGVTASDNERT